MVDEIDTGIPVGNEFPNQELNRDDIIQIIPSHRWGGCIAVVDDVRSWGCQCYVTVPPNGPEDVSAPAYIRLNWGEFEPLGTKAKFIAD